MDYEKTLETVKQMVEDGQVSQETAELYFPELAESEDEKIRKAIIEFFKLQDDNTTYSLVPKNDILAWLEKQGQQKPANKPQRIISAEVKEAMYDKPWSEEDKDFMYDTLSNLTELKDKYGEGYGNVGKCIDWLKSLRPQNRWKPSDEQLEALRIAAEVGTANNSWAMDILKCVYQYLKKLREE